MHDGMHKWKILFADGHWIAIGDEEKEEMLQR
jgi:hypothetical protein